MVTSDVSQRLIAATLVSNSRKASFEDSCLCAGLSPEKITATDWQDAFRIACRHRIGGFFAHFALLSGHSAISRQLQAQIDLCQEMSRTSSLAFLEEFRKINVLFTAAGIPVSPIKGVSLLLWGYEDRPYRMMSDVDILIPASQRKKALLLLLSNGFSYQSPHARWRGHHQGRVALLTAGGIAIDLHWHPVFQIGSHFVVPHGVKSGRLQESLMVLGDVTVTNPLTHLDIVRFHSAQDGMPTYEQVLDVAVLHSRACPRNGQKACPAPYPASIERGMTSLIRAGAEISSVGKPISDATMDFLRVIGQSIDQRVHQTRRIDALIAVMRAPRFAFDYVWGYVFPKPEFYGYVTLRKRLALHYRDVFAVFRRWLLACGRRVLG